MTIDFIDQTGRLRSDEDIQEALVAVKSAMLKIDGDPKLMVTYPTIIEALNELLSLRQAIRKKAPGYGK